ncbi:protein TOO MANY MOUTHS [Selaginella moellendorffii]|nr:protein TOO MANY MOUTHS [Selaginella moellendorffii]|eukprot:XP_002974795.2 protein TOO MANY MOUTHS [Selaginella moellendorffii]
MNAQEEPVTDPVEAAAVFQVLQGINYEIDWKGMFPGDPCTGGPHGIACDIDSNNVYHVVELNLGWVSDYVNNPPCSFNASIHPAIFRFKHLKKLFFYKCFVHSPVSIPPEIIQLKDTLQHLTFQNNPSLVGTIPVELGNLTSLERLVLAENSLEGAIPAEVGNLQTLRQLVLSHNRLAGRVPRTIGGLTSLVILDLSENKLTGEIPSQLYSLAELQKMDLSHNRLQGPIAEDICNLQALQFLDLSYNNLSGRLPDKLGQLASLQYLFLGSNLIGAELPNIWDSLGNLIAVGLSNSRYAGPIPASIGALQKLNSLSLDGNQFSGRIPSNIGTLPNLYHMNLSANSLFGPVPFTSSLVGRLGRNLIVRNNTGLCYEHSMVSDVPDALGLAPCSSLSSSTRGGSPAGLPASSSVASFSSAVFHVFAILLLQMQRL